MRVSVSIDIAQQGHAVVAALFSGLLPVLSYKTCCCFCRSCDAGLQAGAAKCQTLTLFASRRAVENFIQTHVCAAITQHHMFVVDS